MRAAWLTPEPISGDDTSASHADDQPFPPLPEFQHHGPSPNTKGARPFSDCPSWHPRRHVSGGERTYHRWRARRCRRPRRPNPLDMVIGLFSHESKLERENPKVVKALCGGGTRWHQAPVRSDQGGNRSKVMPPRSGAAPSHRAPPKPPPGPSERTHPANMCTRSGRPADSGKPPNLARMGCPIRADYQSRLRGLRPIARAVHGVARTRPTPARPA